ncbi:MAG: hypothetical protein AAGF23_04850 [Acidobacteriota bacterium]
MTRPCRRAGRTADDESGRHGAGDRPSRLRLADATGIEHEEGATVRWLPLQEFDNEGPGYGTSAARLLTLLPRSVEVAAREPDVVSKTRR